MKNEVFYYYLRNAEHHPYGCVAIQRTSDGKINRGVSICSTADRWNRACARGIALKRCQEAGESLFSTPFGTYNGAKRHMPEVKFAYKSECNATPTEDEAKIIAMTPTKD